MVDSIGKAAITAIQRGLERASESATRIANPKASGDSTAMVDAFMDLASAKRDVQAGRKLAQIDDELQREVLDIIA